MSNFIIRIVLREKREREGERESEKGKEQLEEGEARGCKRGKRKTGQGMTVAVIYNNRIKQIRANQPTHEYIMLPRLIYDYNVRV